VLTVNVHTPLSHLVCPLQQQRENQPSLSDAVMRLSIIIVILGIAACNLGHQCMCLPHVGGPNASEYVRFCWQVAPGCGA